MSVLLRALQVEQLEADRFRGPAVPTRLHRTYGGQVAAQALVAAQRTVPVPMMPHSLHSYFLREGDPLAPIDYAVDRVRDGRSFATRRVDASQGGKTVFTLTASFRSGDDGPVHQDVAPDVVAPEDVEGTDGQPLEVLGAEWPDWDFRVVPGPRGVPQQRVWLRHRAPLPDDPLLHTFGLTYATDLTLLGCTRLPHLEERVQMASLDHSVWFLRPFRIDDWLLYDETSPSAGGGRTLAQGRLFDRAGHLVASVVQEGLMRFARES